MDIESGVELRMLICSSVEDVTERLERLSQGVLNEEHVPRTYKFMWFGRQLWFIQGRARRQDGELDRRRVIMGACGRWWYES